ncbi:hypothetical protein ES703_105203 [subsurface metagenome]
MTHEPGSLREIAIELADQCITLAEAKRGLKVAVTLLDVLGVPVEQWQQLIDAARRFEDPAFAHAAMKLIHLEREQGVDLGDLSTTLNEMRAEAVLVEKQIGELDETKSDRRREIQVQERQISRQKADIEGAKGLIETLKQRAAKVVELEKKVGKKGFSLDLLFCILEEVRQSPGEVRGLIKELGSLAKANKKLDADRQKTAGINVRLAQRKQELEAEIKELEESEKSLSSTLNNTKTKIEELMGDLRLLIEAHTTLLQKCSGLFSFTCKHCGARFIVDREAKFPMLGGYHCPSCDFSNPEPDNTFMFELVTPPELAVLLLTCSQTTDAAKRMAASFWQQIDTK